MLVMSHIRLALCTLTLVVIYLILQKLLLCEHRADCNQALREFGGLEKGTERKTVNIYFWSP